MAKKSVKKHFRTVPEYHQESMRYRNLEMTIPEC